MCANHRAQCVVARCTKTRRCDEEVEHLCAFATGTTSHIGGGVGTATSTKALKTTSTTKTCTHAYHNQGRRYDHG